MGNLPIVAVVIATVVVATVVVTVFVPFFDVDVHSIALGGSNLIPVMYWYFLSVF